MDRKLVPLASTNFLAVGDTMTSRTPPFLKIALFVEPSPQCPSSLLRRNCPPKRRTHGLLMTTSNCKKKILTRANVPAAPIAQETECHDLQKMQIVAAHDDIFLPSPFELRITKALRRRLVLFWLLLAGSGGKEALAEDGEDLLLQLRLEPYIDENEGFILQRPVQWVKVQKAGATALFEDPTSKGNNIGVVVNPVRITSLRDFGSPDAVAEKILQAEKKKSSTNDVQLILVKERQLHGGIPLYELEYKLDSTRGMKRILSAVTVASKKLYILNISYTDSLQNPLLLSTASVLQQIVDSFDVL